MPLIKTESRFFIFLVAIAATSVATWAAIFSVTGLSMLYSGALVYVAIAMGVLEFAKIIVASYLYRHWEDTAKWLRAYLTTALILLMLITSGGIYGYLTNSYQGATLGLDKINSQTQVFERMKVNLVAERERLTGDIATLRSERQSTIENRNAEIAANNMATDSSSVKYRAWRNGQVHKRYNVELTNIDSNVSKYVTNLDSTNVRISRAEQTISDKKLELIDTGIDVGPLVYLSRMFNTSMDSVMKWFTLVIVFVFDPLAIALVLALNAIIVRKQETQYTIGVDPAIPGSDTTAIVVGTVEEDEIKVALDSITLEDETDDIFEDAKPVEQAFEDIKERIDERPRFSEPNKKVVSIPDNELIGISMVKEGGEPITEVETIEPYEYSQRPDIESQSILQEFVDVQPMKAPTDVEFNTDFGDPEEQYNKDIEPEETITEQEITDTFEDSAREMRKKQFGQVSNVVYESGGTVTVDHSIQEDGEV